MIVYQNLNFVFIFLPLLSLIFVLLWAVFFFFYSPRKTTPSRILFTSFFLGVSAALVAFLIEQLFLFFTNLDLSFLQSLFIFQKPIDLIKPLFLSFFFIALIEETIKFIILKEYLKSKKVNQVIDGMKTGLWLGLGFAFVENVFYFLNFYSQLEILKLLMIAILLRGVFSTLAHALYGAVMGYYLSLAKFNRLFQNQFARKAFLANLVIHGFFNFFLIINLGGFSVLILISILIIIIIWYSAKKNLELYVLVEGKKMARPPFWASRLELETLLSKQKASDKHFEELLRLFPPKK